MICRPCIFKNHGECHHFLFSVTTQQETICECPCTPIEIPISEYYD